MITCTHASFTAPDTTLPTHPRSNTTLPRCLPHRRRKHRQRLPPPHPLPATSPPSLPAARASSSPLSPPSPPNPTFCATFSGTIAAAARFEYGSTFPTIHCNTALRRASPSPAPPPPPAAAPPRSTRDTPPRDGHAVSHARHTRHRSKCSNTTTPTAPSAHPPPPSSNESAPAENPPHPPSPHTSDTPANTTRNARTH